MKQEKATVQYKGGIKTGYLNADEKSLVFICDGNPLIRLEYSDIERFSIGDNHDFTVTLNDGKQYDFVLLEISQGMFDSYIGYLEKYASDPKELTDFEPIPGKRPENLKDYIDNYADPTLRKNIRTAAIVFYAACALTFVLSVLVLENPLGLIDVALILPLAVIMHVKKSKGCAIALLVISITEMIVTSVLTKRLSGYVVVIAAIIAIAAFYKAEEEYNKKYPTK